MSNLLSLRFIFPAPPMIESRSFGVWSPHSFRNTRS